MADYVTLMGAESVQTAGYVMREAANTMSSAASTISNTPDQLQRVLDNFMDRFTEQIDRLEKLNATKA
jgi:hypothetical protein